MSTPYESANLIVRLYELRRDPTMRDARTWYFRSFHPTSADDLLQTVNGPNSAYFRMVTSYWDMAASFVVNGAIDEKMFNDATGEQMFVFLKIEPFLAEYRIKMGNPAYLASLEQVVTHLSDSRLAPLRERLKAMAQAATR